MYNNYVVPVGAFADVIEVSLTSVSTSAFDALDIITNDKVAINNCLSGSGQPVEFTAVSILVTDTDASPTQKDMTLYIFNNLATDTLGISSGDAFDLGISNTIANVAGIVTITTEDFKAVDTKNVIARIVTAIKVKPSQTESNSLSFAIKANEAQTYDASHSIKVRFETEKL